MMLLRGGDEVTATEALVARAFPWAALTLIVATWLFVAVMVANNLMHLVSGGRHLLTLAVLLMAPILDTMIRGLVNNLVPAMTGEGEIAERAYRSTKRSYIRIGRVVVFGIVIAFIARLWQVDFSVMASAGFGARFAAGMFEVLMIGAIGYLAWEVVTLAVNRKLAAEQTAAAFDLTADEPTGGEGGGVGGSRLSTVLPLVRWTAQVTIIVITVLVGLGNIGIDITPLLAGAGIAGLAIGFGAQKLVADIVSGIFFLVDDAFRTGEYVEIDGTMGTVERISIRSLQLRHHRGAVHTIPFGEIPKITNYSRDWVIMKLRFTVPFDTDLDRVKKIFKQIGAEMAADPVHGPDMMQPFKSQGVLNVDDVGIVVRGKFMARPGKQFTLRKAIYDKVQKAFEDNGIQFARKEIRVRIDGGENATPEERRRAAAAAAGEAAQPDPVTAG
jgi:small-conductance mechanosensitive channel